MLVIRFGDNTEVDFEEENDGLGRDIHCFINSITKLSKDEYYLIHNGKKLLEDASLPENGLVHLVLRQPGGKGGFGSMLRAIGAQIEKTTNREACRDLSGRRLRDINEEKRLKNWIAKQPEREREALEKKVKKIERLCSKPKHKFEDAQYEKERSELPEKVHSAVEQGLKNSTKDTTMKRCKPTNTAVKNKKAKLWIDADLDDLSDSDDSETDGPSCIDVKSHNHKTHLLDQPSTSKGLAQV